MALSSSCLDLDIYSQMRNASEAAACLATQLAQDDMMPNKVKHADGLNIIMSWYDVYEQLHSLAFHRTFLSLCLVFTLVLHALMQQCE